MRTRFSPWKSLRRRRIVLRPRVLQIVLISGVVAGVGVLASLHTTAPARVVYLACAQSPQEMPLLYPAGTCLVRSAPSTLEPFADLELVSPPRVSYDGTRVIFSGRRIGEDYAQVWEADASGNLLGRRTNEPADCVTPDYLPDGRIVFTRLTEGSKQGTTEGVVFVLEPAGEVHRISFGNSLDLVDHVLEDGRVLIRRVTPEHPRGLELALRPDGTELERYLDSKPREEAAVRMPTATENLPGVGDSIALDKPGSYEVITVVPLGPRRRPPVATSVVNANMDHGWLLCLDVRQTDLKLDLARAHSARIVGAESGMLLAQTPIESDGSFFVQVPSDKLFKVEILDDRGEVLVRQGAGIWVRPNEHRGCIGCHEPRYLSPRNQMPLALQKQSSDVSAPQVISQRLREGK